MIYRKDGSGRERGVQFWPFNCWMNWSIMPFIVLFQSEFLDEKHSAHVALPPSFSAASPGRFEGG